MKDVQVRVYDKQIYTTHSDETENTFKGTMAIKDNDIYILYKDETTQTKTTVKVVGQGVSIKRSGSLNGHLQFYKNEIKRSSYGTPFGNMLIDIKTQNVEVYLLEKGVKIYIEYSIIMNEEKVSDNIFMIMAN